MWQSVAISASRERGIFGKKTYFSVAQEPPPAMSEAKADEFLSAVEVKPATLAAETHDSIVGAGTVTDR